MPRTRRAAAAPLSRTRPACRRCRTRRAAVAVVLSLSVLSAAGCSASSDPSAPPAAESSPATAAPVADAGPSVSAFATTVGTRVALARVGSLGPLLVDDQGRTLYLYGADTSVHATCLDECAKSWPPVTTPGFPSAGPGVDDGLLGAAALPDGTAQVLYKGHPLYRYTGDHGPGETAGHTVAGPQGPFYAVTSLGDPVGVDIAALRGAGGAVPSPGASASVSTGAATGAGATPAPDATTDPTASPTTPQADPGTQTPAAQTPATQTPATQTPALATQAPADGSGAAPAGGDPAGGGAPVGGAGSQPG
ncbi:secreted repeat protein with Y-X4-D motif [Kitasatospora sp. SolWspMP-SS2h]|uniref:COG4315 family predicted lipoprotein n=1 Tax=Kitasatospora sp. SolWspMP-SS2h TaxID=1305729 RepID=UPI000DB9831A|nr:hypothetical protein [Kitasatospora sp. SolWspMP-SS2h]RAJ40431.1 secreted repeat protein with Y-X4-D motif [Kitasatospora sp. SolWspMP-SS2h]